MGQEKWFYVKLILYKKPNPLYAVNIIMYYLNCVCVRACVGVWFFTTSKIFHLSICINRIKQCNCFMNIKGALNLNRSHNTSLSMTWLIDWLSTHKNWYKSLKTEAAACAWGCDTSGNIPPCGVALRRTCRCTEFHRVKNANLRHPSAVC